MDTTRNPTRRHPSAPVRLSKWFRESVWATRWRRRLKKGMIDSTRMIPKTHQDKTRPISEYHHYSRSILALGGTNCDKSIYPGVAGEGIFLLLSSVQVASTVRSCCHCELRLRAIFGYLLLLFAGKKSMVVRTRYLASSFVVFFVCITASSYSRPRKYV